MNITIEEKIYDNPKLREFLDSLENQRDRDMAGKAIQWVKSTYPHFADELNGELITVIERNHGINNSK